MSWQNTLKVEKSDPIEILQGIATLFGIAVETVRKIIGKVKGKNLTQRLKNILRQFTSSETIEGKTYPVEVMTHTLWVYGEKQVISGYVLHSISLLGQEHEIDIIVPIDIVVSDSSKNSKVKIERIPREDIAKRIIEDKEW